VNSARVWPWRIEPLYGYVRTLISSPFFHQIVDFSAKSSLLLSRIVLRESFVDPILVIERHFYLKSDTRDCMLSTQKIIGHSILIVVKKKICMLFKNCSKPNIFTALVTMTTIISKLSLRHFINSDRRVVYFVGNTHREAQNLYKRV